MVSRVNIAGSVLIFSKMATFGWSYKSNVCGVKRPKEQARKVEGWQKDRTDVKVPLHSQTHSAESVNAGMKRRRYNPRAKIYVGNLSKDTKPVTLAEYFSFFGEIAYMKLMKDRETGISRGFAFITFVEVEAADKATRWCKNNHPRLDDREIKVGLAERRQRRVIRYNQQGMPLRNNTQPERRDTHTLYWEYKWSEDPSAEVYGPYETSLMLQWHQADYFRMGCWVRQSGSHIKPNRTTDDQDEQPFNETQPKQTSLVCSYSSSSEDEENESPSEAKRSRLDIPTDMNEDVTTQDRNSGQLQQTVDSLTEIKVITTENEKENKLETNSNNNDNIEQGSNVVSSLNGDLNDQETENQIIGSCDELASNYINKRLSSDVPTDDEDVQDATSSWYQADRGGIKVRDFLGRDSSSEDDEYDFYDIDQQSDMSGSDFVHISEIDFSMFP